MQGGLLIQLAKPWHAGELGFHGTQIQARPSFLLPPPSAPALPNVQRRAGGSCGGNGVANNAAADLWAPSLEPVVLIWAMFFQLDVSKVREFTRGFKSTSWCKTGDGDLPLCISHVGGTPLSFHVHLPRGCRTSGVDTILRAERMFLFPVPPPCRRAGGCEGHFVVEPVTLGLSRGVWRKPLVMAGLQAFM